MSSLELQNVVKTYNEGINAVHALQGVDLVVDAGALVAVMGPSGSGKSTLLTIAGSLEEPTSGEVLVAGAPLSQMSRNDKARLRRDRPLIELGPMARETGFNTRDLVIARAHQYCSFRGLRLLTQQVVAAEAGPIEGDAQCPVGSAAQALGHP